jgi:serine/threonine-protein kinase RsbT
MKNKILTPTRIRKASIRAKVAIRSQADIELIVSLSMALATAIGFKETIRCMIGTAVAELAKNIYRYTGPKGGTVRATIVTRGKRKGLEVIAADKGPGIRNLKMAMQDNFSTKIGSLGIGLPGVKRLMDEFDIKSGKGTTVTARKWLN